MYSLLRGKEAAGRLARELPAAGASIVIAELFYKFHSFSLECLAFLGTWLALSAVAHLLFPVREKRTA
jgi:hypothetical protein